MSTNNYSFDPMNDPRTEFSGKRVLVTGGTKGAGEAIVRRLAAGGATVATTARSERPDGLPIATFIQADLSTLEGTATVVETVLRELGGVDIIVHNVGGSNTPGGGFAAATDAFWLDELNLNLLSAVRLDRLLLPQMIERGPGTVVHISSIQRQLPLHDSTTPYAAAKTALSTYSKALPKELGPKGGSSAGSASGLFLRYAKRGEGGLSE